MPDDINLDPSIEKKEEVTTTDSPSNGGEPMIPKSRLDEESKKVRELREKQALLEEKINLLSNPKPTNDDSDPDLEKLTEALSPILAKKGFITQQQKEEEDNAKMYATQLKELSAKYNGEDGKPVFDPYEISEYAKQTKVFDLETAYEKKYKKELFDWELKHLEGGDVTTEKPSEKVYNNGGNVNILTREEIAKRLAGPGGDAWYEKNREALLKALEKGEIK